MSATPGFFVRLWRGFWRLIGWLRTAVLNLLFLLVVAILIGLMFAERPPQQPVAGALIINPSGELVDQYSYMDPLVRLMESDRELPPETLLGDVIEAIDRAADDARIDMLVLELDALEHGGLSKLQEIGAAIERFRASGKGVVAIGDSYTQDQYWLAAQADEVVLHPLGAVLLPGYGVYRNYYGEALDKLDINVHLFRVGEYKSALEPLVRSDMSEADERANLSWLQSLWGQYANAVVSRRGIEAETFGRYVNEIDQVLVAAGGDAAVAALNWNLVDSLRTREEANRWLSGTLGMDEAGYYRGIDFHGYLARTDPAPAVATTDVGVIFARGPIVDGEQPAGTIGGDTLARLLQQAQEDESIAAVLLRIDSGGGSAFASEVIRRQVLALKDAGKPVVVSMGSVAASGGYWIAAPADEIWATRATLTGSIGIFGALPTLDESLARLGIYNDGVGTTEVADAFVLERPLNPIVARAMQSVIEHGYRQFIDVVAEGRGMNITQVEAIAEGRVWSGVQALENGLVDRLGSLDDAAVAAAQLAGLDDWELRTIEAPLGPVEALMQEFLSTFAPLLPDAFSVAAQRLVQPLLADIRQLLPGGDPRGIYLWCAACRVP